MSHTLYSDDFTSTLRRFLARSRHADQLKQEVKENLGAIEKGRTAEDTPSHLPDILPGSLIHVCPGARVGIIYAKTPAGLTIESLEPVGM